MVALGALLAVLVSLLAVLVALLGRPGALWGRSSEVLEALGLFKGIPRGAQGVVREGARLHNSAQAPKPLPVYMYTRFFGRASRGLESFPIPSC